MIERNNKLYVPTTHPSNLSDLRQGKADTVFHRRNIPEHGLREMQDAEETEAEQEILQHAQTAPPLQPVMSLLTPRQRAILKYCAAYAKEHGYATSIKELAEATGLNRRTVDYNLQRLLAKGYMNYEGSRRIRILFLP